MLFGFFVKEIAYLRWKIHCTYGRLVAYQIILSRFKKGFSMPQDYKVPIEIQGQLADRVEAFNRKYLKKSSVVFFVDAHGKFVYLHYLDPRSNQHQNAARLTYNGDLENMDFAIYKYSSEKYDSKEDFFPGAEHVDGTIEGAMKAVLEAYPV